MASSLLAALESLDQFLYRVSIPLSERLSLHALPPHFSTVVASFVFFNVIQWISPYFLQRLSPEHYGRASARTKHGWAVHVTSTVHCLVVLPMALAAYDAPQLNQDKAFAFTAAVGRVFAVTCGYFIWDVIDSTVYFTDTGFVIHGSICLMVYTQVFRPFLGYYGPRFLFWELSTIFLNIHWFLDKTKRTGGTMQLVNGAILITTFFLVRICYGGMLSLSFFRTLNEIRSQISPSTTVMYTFGNLSLQSLNCYWFCKMILALRKRLVKKSGSNTSNGSATGKKHD